MNKCLLSSAVLAAVTAAIHLFAGGPDVVAPLLDSPLAVEPRLTLYAVWHMATATMILSAAALFVAASPRYATASRFMVLFISALWLSFGAVFLAIATLQPGTGLYLKLPQWALLLPVGVLALLGYNKSVDGTDKPPVIGARQ